MLRFVVLLCTLMPLTSRFGQDSFEVYLKGKLLTHQIVTPPQGLPVLSLTDATGDDEIVIQYHQCNAPDKIGRSRSIFLKDAAGNKLREWRFGDAATGAVSGSSATAMSIPVNDILQAKKGYKGQLTLCYWAVGREYGQAFASI